MEQDYVATWIRQLIRENKVHDFYISPAWQQLRRKILKEQNQECQRCKKNKKIYVPATTVHHKHELRKRPDLALDPDNLEALCDACHYDCHHRKKPGFTNEERW